MKLRQICILKGERGSFFTLEPCGVGDLLTNDIMIFRLPLSIDEPVRSHLRLNLFGDMD